jgi:spore coat protein U-like protein
MSWHRIAAGRLVLLAGLLLLCSVGPALAQSCATPTVSAGGLAFGQVASDILDSLDNDTTGTINYSCNGGAPNGAVRICIALGNFSTGTNRTLARGGGGTAMNFQVYKDAARTQYWGNSGTAYMTIDTTYNGSGVASGSVTMYGRVLSGQTTLQDGSYSRTMSAGALTFTTSMASPCPGGGSRTFSFNATATISNFCNISAAPLSFGSQGFIVANVHAQSDITIQCTNTTPYTVILDAGTFPGATVTTRRMANAGIPVSYSLFRDSGRTLNWGNTSTTDVSGTGSGLTVTHRVYGRVPVQTTPPPATYSDTITATVTY